MACHMDEAAEAVASTQALVCNMGAIEHLESMISAGRAATELGIPTVLDPVGAGGTALRREASRRLLDEVPFTVIRGNASEIRYLAGLSAHGRGVDAADVLNAESLPAIQELARKTGGVIAVSGAVDVLTDGRRTACIRNGCATMARITGSGCMLTALTGAFCGSWADPFEAACAATAAMDVCGELAEERRIRNGTGNATFRTDLIDALFNLTSNELNRRVNLELHED